MKAKLLIKSEHDISVMSYYILKRNIEKVKWNVVYIFQNIVLKINYKIRLVNACKLELSSQQIIGLSLPIQLAKSGKI